MSRLLSRFPNTLYTLGLAALLLPPLLITLYRGGWEPFPALLLPSGAHLTTYVDEEYRYVTDQLLARASDPEIYEVVRLDAAFPRFSSTRLTQFLRRDLLLDEGSGAQDPAEIRRWVSTGRAAEGHRTDSIIVRRVRLRVDVRTRTSAVDSILQQRRYGLD